MAGFIVTESPEQTPGYVAGLRPGDIVTAYDGEIVASDISYKYAREQRSRAGAREAELTVHRGGQVLRLSVPTGLLGFDGFDCTDLMDRINTAYFAGNVTEAERLLTEGLASKALGHAEELVGRIWLIPDDTTPVEEARRDSLLNELGSMCLTSDLPGFAQTYFYRRGHFVAAAALNRRYLALDPDNVSVRLNLALCEAIANRFDQADRDVHMVLDREDAGVSPYGYGVACTICGYVEFGRKNYKQSARYFHDAVELTNPVDDWRLQNRYLVAAANVGLPAFRAARDHVVSIEPSGSSFVSWNAKILECYALAVAGNREEAIQIAHCFPRALPPGLLFELRTFPEGADVVARWDSLWP